MSLDDTIVFINKFSKDIGDTDEEYEFTKIILSEDDSHIVGIQLQNKLMIPVSSIKFNIKKHKKVLHYHLTLVCICGTIVLRY